MLFLYQNCWFYFAIFWRFKVTDYTNGKARENLKGRDGNSPTGDNVLLRNPHERIRAGTGEASNIKHILTSNGDIEKNENNRYMLGFK